MRKTLTALTMGVALALTACGTTNLDTIDDVDQLERSFNRAGHPCDEWNKFNPESAACLTDNGNAYAEIHNDPLAVVEEDAGMGVTAIYGDNWMISCMNARAMCKDLAEATGGTFYRP